MKKALSILLSLVLLAAVITVMPVCAAESSKAKEILSSMSTEDKISQMLMPQFRYWTDAEGNKSGLTEINDDVAASIKKHPYAGVIFFTQNTVENSAATRLSDAMQKANAEVAGRPQLIISIDQEGGSITRLKQGTITPGNMALGAADDLTVTKESAAIIGNELTALGINADFAPDVDVNSNPSNPIIGIRSFSDDPQMVAKHGSAFVQALNETGVISTLKHFPGHGDTDTDSHTGLPLINKSYEELKKNELVPFKACIDAGTQMIMTAHIQYPQIEKTTYKSKLTGEEIYLPATLSKTIITDILRGDMGYKGVVVTDAMDMKAISDHFGKIDAAKLAIEAGVDILLIPVDTSSKEELASMDSYISTLAEKVDNGEISVDCVNAAVLRILELKESRGMLSAYDGTDIEGRVEYAINHVGTKENHEKEWQLAEKCITLVKNDDKTLPLTSASRKVVVITPYDDETIPMEYAVRKLKADGKFPEGVEFEALSYYKKTADEIIPKLEGADTIVFMSENYGAGGLKGDTAKLADTVADEIHSKGGRFIVMSVNLPYDVARYQQADAIMLAYNPESMPEDPGDKTKEMLKYGANMPAALYMMFSAEDAPTAKLPINIPEFDVETGFSDKVLYQRGFGLTYEKEKKDISALDAKLSKESFTYTGKAVKPEVSVDGLTESDYNVTYKNNKNAGKATVVITGKGDFTGSITKTFTIKKAANPVTVKAASKKVKYTALKKAKAVVSPLTVKKNQGKLTYTKLSGIKKITVNAKTGKFTVNKGLKKATYKVKVRVTAKGNSNYKSAKITKTVVIKVV